MTPFDLIIWASAALVAVIILTIPAMIIAALAIEVRRRWRAVGQAPADRRDRSRVRDEQVSSGSTSDRH